MQPEVESTNVVTLPVRQAREVPDYQVMSHTPAIKGNPHQLIVLCKSLEMYRQAIQVGTEVIIIEASGHTALPRTYSEDDLLPRFYSPFFVATVAHATEDAALDTMERYGSASGCAAIFQEVRYRFLDNRVPATPTDPLTLHLDAAHEFSGKARYLRRFRTSFIGVVVAKDPDRERLYEVHGSLDRTTNLRDQPVFAPPVDFVLLASRDGGENYQYAVGRKQRSAIEALLIPALAAWLADRQDRCIVGEVAHLQSGMYHQSQLLALDIYARLQANRSIHQRLSELRSREIDLTSILANADRLC